MVLSYVTCNNIEMFTFEMITLSQDLYWNSKRAKSAEAKRSGLLKY